MKLLPKVLTLLLIAVVLATAGCVSLDNSTPTPTPTVTPADPLSGDPIVGIWTGTLKSTVEGSGTGEVTTTVTDYTIEIAESGSVTFVDKSKTTKKSATSSSTSSSDFTLSGTATKAENVYTLQIELFGTYTMTLNADGTASLTTPGAKVCTLEKQTS